MSSMIEDTSLLDRTRNSEPLEEGNRTVPNASDMIRLDVDVSKPVQKPDRVRFEEHVAQLDKEIAACNVRLQEIDLEITSAKSSSADQVDELHKVQSRLRKLREEKSDVVKERKAIQARQRITKKSFDAKVQQQKGLRSELKYTSPRDIDRRIEEIEKKQLTTSMPLKEEKNLLKEIEQLKQSKKNVMRLVATNESIESERKEAQRIVDLLIANSAELDRLKAGVEEQQVALEALNEVNSSKRARLPSLFQERNTVREKKHGLVEEIRSLRSDFKAQSDQFRKYQKEVRRIRDEAKRAEESARRVEREKQRQAAEEEELNRVPYEEELNLCDYLINFLEIKYPTISAHPDYESADLWMDKAQKRETTVFEGMTLAGKSAFRDDAEYCSLNKKFGKKRGRGKKKGGQKIQDKLSLVPETIAVFGLINLQPPSSIAGIPTSILALRAKKEWFQGLPRGAVPSLREKLKAAEVAGSEKRTNESVVTGGLNARENMRDVKSLGDDGDATPRQNQSDTTRLLDADGFDAAKLGDDVFPKLPCSNLKTQDGLSTENVRAESNDDQNSAVPTEDDSESKIPAISENDAIDADVGVAGA